MKEKTNAQKFDFKVRSWLIRRISGKYKTENLMKKSNEAVLNAVVKTLHETISKEVDTIITRSLAEISNGALVKLITVNENLPDAKKAQLLCILDSPGVDNSRAYLQ